MLLKCNYEINNIVTSEIIPFGFKNYTYSDVPIINGRGFEVKIKSQDDFKSLLDDYNSITPENEKDFYSKWLKFDTYRKISF